MGGRLETIYLNLRCFGPNHRSTAQSKKKKVRCFGSFATNVPKVSFVFGESVADDFCYAVLGHMVWIRPALRCSGPSRNDLPKFTLFWAKTPVYRSKYAVLARSQQTCR